MSHKLENLEKACIRQANVSAHWLPGGDSFWYTQEIAAGKFRFIFVDCKEGIRREAFNHAGLAAELGKRAEKDICPDSLPFKWININMARDCACTRFQFEGQTWKYEGGKLDVCDDGFDGGDLDKGCEEAASPETRQKGVITFVNNTADPIAYYWIDFSGELQYYGTLGVGQVRTRRSYVSHIWCLTVEDSEKKVACAVREKPHTAIVEEVASNLMLRWETDASSEVVAADQDEQDSNSAAKAFVRNFNLWVGDTDGTERQISHDGFADNEILGSHIYPSSNEGHVIAWQCKPPSKHLIHMVESSPKNQLEPKLHMEHYLKPGDNVEVQRPRLFDLVEGKEISVDDSLFHNSYELSNIGWSTDGHKYRFIFNERGHRTLRLLQINLDGVVQVLAEETSKTFVDYANKLYYKIMEPTKELLWTSERDGWNHLYLFNLEDGTLKTQVTKGDWVVRAIESVDEEQRLIWFRGFGMVRGQNPYYSHLACVRFDGSDLRVVTEGDGTHIWKWSPNKRYLIDSWSRVDYPPISVLRDPNTGKSIVDLEKASIEPLVDAGWTAPERFVAPGRDGHTEIHGIIVKPDGFDPSKKYPVVEYIYAGPTDCYTPKAFHPRSKTDRWARDGYVWVQLDGMGTNWRSKAFHDVCHKNLQDSGFPDRIAWLRAAAATRPWMDAARGVGIYGTSAGGQSAAAAVLHHGDVYAAAAAHAGCHDNRLDKLWWNELWMGHPVDASYAAASNATHAHRLRDGAGLLLVVGELDTNVDPASTMRLAHALIEADKDFELVVIPGAGHHVMTLPYVMRKQARFFERHLKDH